MSESILIEAERIVNGERAAAYGGAQLSFARIATGWEVILRSKVSAEQVALCMAWLKLVRETNSHKRDNLVDLAGYAELANRLAGPGPLPEILDTPTAFKNMCGKWLPEELVWQCMCGFVRSADIASCPQCKYTQPPKE